MPVDPNPYLLSDGRIRLYYFDIGEARSMMGSKPATPPTNKIYSAISTDGIHFTAEDGVRFEQQEIFDPNVIKVGDTWRLYVGTGSNKVLSATSSDGLTFTYEGVAVDGGAVPDVYYTGEEYILYTAGIDIYTSTDGKTFTSTNNSFRSSAGMVTADPGVIKLSDGTYLMVYKTK